MSLSSFYMISGLSLGLLTLKPYWAVGNKYNEFLKVNMKSRKYTGKNTFFLPKVNMHLHNTHSVQICPLRSVFMPQVSPQEFFLPWL